jgi:molecular chaperone HtpG
MPSPAEHFRMETDFEGLIQLLAKHLYSEPDVFVRELIQNCNDAIERRVEQEKDLAGRIEVTVNDGDRTIIFRDNGVGMDEVDIKKFLSVIGASGTLKAMQKMQEQGRAAADRLIGQFGIGFLSAFLVAERVEVRTRKTGTQAAFKWQNSGSLDCELLNYEMSQPGTEIVVLVAKDKTYILDERRLAQVIRKYCDFIPTPILLNGKGPINELDIPFYRTHWDSPEEKRVRYDMFVRRRYPDMPLDVIPVEIDGPYQASGVLMISDRSIPDIETSGVMEVLIRRMFIKAEDTNLLPAWAKFVRGVIDSKDLEPTAARDSYKMEHPSVAHITRRLGEIIVERLTYLSKEEPHKFQRINQWHHYHLKGMATIHADFFRQVAGLLLFETNHGQMSLETYLTKNAPRPDLGNKVPIYFFSSLGSSAQFKRMADARDLTVINAGHVFEEEFLGKYQDEHTATTILVRLDTGDDPLLFQRLSPAEEDRFSGLQNDLQGHLGHIGSQNVRVRMRRFQPADVPAVVIASRRTEQETKVRNILARAALVSSAEGILEEMLNEDRELPLFMNLNADNRLIQKLSELNRQTPIARSVMTGLYNCAIVHSHNLLTEHNTRVMHDQFLGLLGNLLDSQDAHGALRTELEQERQKLIHYRAREVEAKARQPEHIRLFMMTPFDDSYARLEEAIREIFETHPYYFEVKLARDFTFEPSLLKNVREHMIRAHGFIAEISALNANVMFELGAVMLVDDSRPVFTLRCKGAEKNVPADLLDKLRIEYNSLADAPDRLVSDIRANLERDGRIIHEQILDLLAQRKKRFLSKKLLESTPVRLQQSQTDSIMQHYSSVEDFLAADPSVVSQLTGVRDSLLTAIRGELSIKNAAVQ